MPPKEKKTENMISQTKCYFTRSRWFKFGGWLLRENFLGSRDPF